MTMIDDTFGRLPARLLTLAFALLCPQATAAPAVGEGGASIADKEFEVIQIIGTHIRGVEEGASPVFVFSREDIEATGFSLTHQFIQHVPQNFSGGASETNANLGADGIVTNGGTGLNLRGLGSDSSLVLLNGHRVAPGGRGEFTDIGMFPLSAIERIELMSDGASAIYGSDAVGGVVNFILRDQFQGAESRIRYGTTSEDSVDELQLGQTFGHSWLEGDALVSYEYYQRDHLFARDRHFTRELNDPYSLLPKVERHTLFLAGTRHIGTWLTLSGDGLFSRRDNSSYQATTPTGPGRPDNTREDVEQVIAGMKVTVELNESWSLDLGGSYSHNKSRSESRYLETDSGGEPPKGHKESVVWSIDAISDGIVLSLPGGYSRLAIGGHFRHEGYRDFQSLERWGVETDTDRDIYGALTEWFIPVVGPNNRLPGAERLELTLAVRYEDYSDVGETTDPKVGVLWSPLAELDLRATWGTSFRAPLLVELLEVTNIVGLMNLDDPSSTSPSGRTLALTAFGQNPPSQTRNGDNLDGRFQFQAELSARFRS